jgi:hypothetical protein
LDQESTLRSEEYSIYLISLGQFDVVIQAWEQALGSHLPGALDRFVRQSLIQVYYAKGDMLACDKAGQRDREAYGDAWLPLAILALISIDRSDLPNAIRLLTAAQKLTISDQIEPDAEASRSNPVACGLGKLQKLLFASMSNSQEESHMRPDNLVEEMILIAGYCFLNMEDEVLAVLNRFADERYPPLCWLLWFPCIRRAVGERPEFHNLILRVGASTRDRKAVSLTRK